MIWFVPQLSEIVFAVLMFASWIMFLAAMSRINKCLRHLPNCATNEWVTMSHFVILSLQGFAATLYSVFYILVYLVEGEIDTQSTDLRSL